MQMSEYRVKFDQPVQEINIYAKDMKIIEAKVDKLGRAHITLGY